MARITAYVYKSRHNVFYFRLRIPLDLEHLTSQKNIRRSLKTSNRKQACIAAARWLECCEEIFAQARSTNRLSLTKLKYEGVTSLGAHETRYIPSKAVENSSPLLSEVAKELTASLQKDGVGPGVIDGKLATVRLMVEVLGDLPVDQYTRLQCRKFKDTALKLPPRNRANAHLTVEQAIKSVDSKTISRATFNNYVKDLSSVFNYALREGYCDNNPMLGLKLKTSQKASEERQKYTENDIRALFSSELFRSGGYAEKPYKYWLPLLALYTGARMNELCQLYLDDVKETSGFIYIDINDSRPDQRLKSIDSRRVVPIHSKLQELGFVKYVSELKRAGQKRLFPELKYQEKRGYSASPSKWFARYKKEQLGCLHGQTKDFHSFRHTVADCFKQKGLPESVAASILGHRASGITYNRYGKDFALEALVGAMEVIDLRVEGVYMFRCC